LATWRQGGRASALAALAQGGRVHAPATPDQAKTEAAGAYLVLTGGITDPHTRVRSVLLMAATNADVDDLNSCVRARLLADGHLGAASPSRGPREPAADTCSWPPATWCGSGATTTGPGVPPTRTC